MKGILPFLATNLFANGSGGFPAGEGDNSDLLSETQIKHRPAPDLGTVGGEDRHSSGQRVPEAGGSTPSSPPAAATPAKASASSELVSVYESDFGVCRVVLSALGARRHGAALGQLADSRPSAGGRSFHYKPEAATGDRDAGQLIGEYTLELRKRERPRADPRIGDGVIGRQGSENPRPPFGASPRPISPRISPCRAAPRPPGLRFAGLTAGEAIEERQESGDRSQWDSRSSRTLTPDPWSLP